MVFQGAAFAGQLQVGNIIIEPGVMLAFACVVAICTYFYARRNG